MRIAIVTCSTLLDLTPADRLFADALRYRDAEAVAVAWDDPAAAWDTFDAIVLRSPWDYFHHLTRFKAWLDRLESHGCHVINPVGTVRWNSHKRYLLELEQHGCGIPATRLVPRGDPRPLAAHLGETGWARAVIKPAVSGGAWRTMRVDGVPSAANEAADEAAFATTLAAGDVVLQEYLEEVAASGEWSLMYFDGRFSHAVLKRPAAGDFRVQRDLGGSVHAGSPPPAVSAAASRALAALPAAAVYARMDLVATARGVLLMEAELIEPYLFLEHHPPAAAAFVDAVERSLATSRRSAAPR
jgi:glutathione synthase/RimK-type ligase-like ATP-grasp enzyme